MKTSKSTLFTSRKKITAMSVFVFRGLFLLGTFNAISISAFSHDAVYWNRSASNGDRDFGDKCNPSSTNGNWQCITSGDITGKSSSLTGADNAPVNSMTNFNTITTARTQYFVKAEDCAIISPITTTSCDGITFTITPSDGTNGTVPAGTTYSWPAPSGTGFSGGEASTGLQTSISGTLGNLTNAPVTATYSVTPLSGTCTGANFTVTVTVYPSARLSTNIPVPGTVCSGTQFNFTASSLNPGTSFYWLRAAIDGITEPANSGTGNISETLHNTSLTNIPVKYHYILSANGCTNTFSEDVIIVVVPAPVVTVSAPVSAVCPNVSFSLYSTSNLGIDQPVDLLNEDFEPTSLTLPNWTPTIQYTQPSGGDEDASPTLWTIRQSPWTTRGVPVPYSPVTINSNTNNAFYISENSGNFTNPTSSLTSPAIPTTGGYTTLALDFWQYYRDKSPKTGSSWHLLNDSACIDVSTNNFLTYTTVRVYNATQGEPDNFAHERVDLSAFIKQTNVRIRFRFQPNADYYWAIDNVRVIGTLPVSGFAWTSSQPVPGFPNTLNVSPGGIIQPGTTTYVATYTDLNSTCSGSDTITVTSYSPPERAIISPAGSFHVNEGAQVPFTIISGKGNSRQWNLYGSPQNGETGEYYTTKPLLYFDPSALFIPYQYVTLITKDENGCRAISDTTIIYVDSIQSNGIPDAQLKANNFTARFADHKITIFGSPEHGTRAWLYTMNGRKMSGEYLLTSESKNEIPATGLSSGIYLLRIEGNTIRQTIKVSVPGK